MTSPGQPAAVGRPAAADAQPPDAQPPDMQSAGGGPGDPVAVPLWMPAVPALVTLAVVLWGIGEPSYTRDEAATLSAVQRPFAEMLRMLGNVDVGHAGYYVVMWPIVRLVGSGELATRLPSALAMAVAAAAVTGLGRRLVSPRAGLAAGLVFAIMPAVSLYGHTMRPYAMATALAAAASYLLVRAIQAAAAGAGVRGWLTGYAALLVVLGYIHPLALLLVAAHAVPVAQAWLRSGGAAAGRGAAPGRGAAAGRSLALGWLAAAVAAVVLTSPLIVLTRKQTAPINWAKAPVASSIIGLTKLVGPPLMVAAAALAVLCAIVVTAAAGRARLRARLPSDLVTLCLPWLIVPPAILIGVSVITPVYTFRYIMFCAPAAAVLLGAGLAALGWRAGTAAFVIIAVLAVSAQRQLHDAPGGDDIRQVDQIIATNMRPGDGLMYEELGEPIVSAYPYGLRQLPNLLQSKSPIQSGTLGGARASMKVVRQRLAKTPRVWAVQYYTPTVSVPHVFLQLPEHHFRRVGLWHSGNFWLSLWLAPGKG